MKTFEWFLTHTDSVIQHSNGVIYEPCNNIPTIKLTQSFNKLMSSKIVFCLLIDIIEMTEPNF